MKRKLFMLALLFVSIASWASKMSFQQDPPAGCLTASWGQYPAETYVPFCLGVDEEITHDGIAGDYSVIQVTNGVAYTFTCSAVSDFLTIGNQQGTEVLAAGTGPVNWTATFDGEIRFYTHVDDQCTEEIAGRTRYIRCGQIPPPPGCNEHQVVTNIHEQGYTFEGANQQRLAVDIMVPEGAGFHLTGAKINMLDYATSFSFKFYTDADGLPGEEIASVSGNLLGNEFIVNNFGHDFVAYSIQFDDMVDLEGATTYWMEVITDGYAWEYTTAATAVLGAFGAYRNTGLGSWALVPQTEFVYRLFCDGAEISSPVCGQAFDAGITDVGVNLNTPGEAGYRVANDFNVQPGQVFSLEKVSIDGIAFTGEVTTFDLYVYHDESGPGELISSFTALTPTSVTPNGALFGLLPKSVIEFTLPQAQVLSGGNEGQKYWVGISAAASTTNDYVQWAAYPYQQDVSEPLYTSTDAGATWEVFEHAVSGGSREGVMILDGNCETLGIEGIQAVSMQAYPNPVGDVLAIDSVITIIKVEVFTMSGQKIISEAFAENTAKISVTHLPAGMYLAKIYAAGGETKQLKILKD